MGTVAVLAHGGAHALELLRSGEAGALDVALLDGHMPGVDGLELARAMRGQVSIRDLPLVMLTSSLVREQRAEYDSYRFAAVFQKPVRPAALRPVLCNLFGTAGTDPSPADTHPGVVRAAHARRSARVLIAEDNPTGAADGREARAPCRRGRGYAALEALERSRYDLVLMDGRCRRWMAMRGRWNCGGGRTDAAAACR